MGKYTRLSKEELAKQNFKGCPGFDDIMSALSDGLIFGVKEELLEKDIQQFTTKGRWYNLPQGLDSDLIERILYYKGRGVLFYLKSIDRFYFLPFALNGSIDVYGRYLDVTPIIFGGSDDNDKDKAFIDGLVKSPIYDVLIPEQLTNEILENGCVILNDRTQRRTQILKTRAQLQEPYISLEASMIALIRTALMNKVGVKGVKSSGPDDSTKIIQASKSKWLYATAGFTYLPIENGFESLDIDSSTETNIQEMLMGLNAIDNMRLDNLGIRNGGIFEKQGTILQTEADFGLSATQLIDDDATKNRQRFCNIVNSIWNLGIWYEPFSQVNEQEALKDQTGTNQMYDNEYSNDNGGGSDEN
jgi:hypothetical protein